MYRGCIKTNVNDFRFPEDIRPVKLNKIVLGYPYYPHGSSPFKFDIMLSYKLQPIMLKYSEGKPVLVSGEIKVFFIHL